MVTTCAPRFATKPTDRESLGPKLAAIAAALKLPLMPWQQRVADVGLELLPGTTIPAYREVVVTVPRQQGKTTLMLAFALLRCLAWPSGQQVAYTAQTGGDARAKLLIDIVPHLENSALRETVRQVNQSNGREGVVFSTGSRIDIFASLEASGHGRVIDLAILDEAFDDRDDRREQALLPAMMTRADAQLLIVSTAGTERSPYLKRKVQAGRDAVASGRTEGICYFEWSADPDADPGDPATWWSCMPALGHTVDERTIEHSFSTMAEGEFRRAFLNTWTVSDERVIPAALWDAVRDDTAHPEGRLVFGIDVSPDRSSAAICVADSEHRAELIEHRPGTGWVVDRAAELVATHRGEIVVDGRSPAASFVPDFHDRGLGVHVYSTDEMTAATGKFMDRIADGQMRVRGSEALADAVAGAQHRFIGDLFVWARKSADADVSPLVALTIALHKAAETAEIWFAYD